MPRCRPLGPKPILGLPAEFVHLTSKTNALLAQCIFRCAAPFLCQTVRLRALRCPLLGPRCSYSLFYELRRK